MTAAFLNLPQPDIENPTVHLHKGQDADIAVIYLDAAHGVTMHIREAEMARKLAAVFTEAAELLTPQQTEFQEFRAWKAAQEAQAEGGAS